MAPFQNTSTKLRDTLAQHALDFLVPVDRTWFKPEEVAKIIGFSDRFVHALIDEGKLTAYEHNGQKVIPGVSGEKMRRRILRPDLVLYLLTSRNVHPAEDIARLCSVIDTLDLTAAQLVSEHAIRHRNRRAQS